MTAAGETFLCLHVLSADVGNGVHRYLCAEVVSALPAIPETAEVVNVSEWMEDIVSVSRAVGFEIPLDAHLVGVIFVDDLGIAHSYYWADGGDAGSRPKFLDSGFAQHS